MRLKASSNPVLAARKLLARFALIGLVLALIGAAALPALAQERAYTDRAGRFTTTIPAGWADESTSEYGKFTKSGVSVYLIAVERTDIQASIDAAVASLAPDLSGASQTLMGEFSAPSGMWTQVIFSLPGGEVGNAVAQSSGEATVVLLVTADSMAVMQTKLDEANAILASVSIEGASPGTPEPDAPAAVSQAQGEITFPEPTGAYAVGRISAIWRDDSRDEAYTPDVVDSRIVRVWVWYPAAPAADSEIAPYLPDAMSALFQQLYGIDPSGVHSHAYESAPVLTTSSGYPVLVFSPGNGYNAVFSSALLEDVASYGYVIVGVDHAYNALLTTLADGQVVMRPDTGTSESDEAFATRMADVEFVIDQLAQVNSSDDILKGSLELTRMGLIGHSFGGQTVAEVCRVDVRCQAVLVNDVPLRGEVAEIGLSQPIMLTDTERISGEQMIEEAETLAGQEMPNAEMIIDLLNQRWIDRDTTADMLLTASSDAYRVGIDGSRHNNITDVPLLAAVQPALLSEVGGTASIDPERAQRVIGDYTLAFFDTYLKGEPAPLLDGASADYPEVTFTRGES